jgi:FkbM family methyltransferase
VSVKDIDSKACIFSTVLTRSNAGMTWWMMPLPKIVIDFYNNPKFGGFLIEFRDTQENLLESRERRIKDIPFKKPVIDISNTEPVFMNYEEFFIDRVYDNLDLDNCKTVLDIGANVGLWTKYILSRNARKVYCFEPNKKALSHLKYGLRNDNNATIIEKAVYKEDATLKFYINEENSLTSSVLPESGHSPSYDVDAISLENAINLTGEDKIDLVKIDIEGAEFDIIENLSQGIFDRIDSFLIEYHDFYFTEGMEKVNALEQQLERAGYTIHRSTIPNVKYVFASRIKKNYWVNRNGLLELNNLHDFSKTFSWEEFNAGNQTGYHHMFNELHFSEDQYTKGCNYERFDCVIEKGDVVVDVGANIGMFANVAYHKGASEILCFEPSDIAFECLVRNKPFKTKTFKAAVLDYIGMAKISLPSQDDTMGASIGKDYEFSNYVPSITLDKLFEDGIVDRIDFLKIDCEGSEKQVLLGVSDQNLDKIRKISMEFHMSHLTESDSQNIINRLTAHGFRSFQLFLGDGALRIYNFWK